MDLDQPQDLDRRGEHVSTKRKRDEENSDKRLRRELAEACSSYDSYPRSYGALGLARLRDDQTSSRFELERMLAPQAPGVAGRSTTASYTPNSCRSQLSAQGPTIQAIHQLPDQPFSEPYQQQPMVYAQSSPSYLHVAPFHNHGSTQPQLSLDPSTPAWLSNAWDHQACRPPLPEDMGHARASVVMQPVIYHNDGYEKELRGDTAIEAETVCFGMLPNIEAKCQLSPAHLKQNKLSWPIQFDSAFKFSAVSGIDLTGRVPPEITPLFESLIESDDIVLEATCEIQDTGADPRKILGTAPRLVPCLLSVIVYGSSDLFEEVGDLFQELDKYLQDPLGCHKDVKYYNPHRISCLDLAACEMTSAVSKHGFGNGNMMVEITEQVDLLSVLDSKQHLAEAQQPAAIRTPLKCHQKQALTFMIEREKGWSFDKQKQELWELRVQGGGTWFINRVSNMAQATEPLQFRGGIIADPMGLGKTLTVIALIATDSEATTSNDEVVDTDSQVRPQSRSTLIVVPPTLLDAWEEQLTQHVHESRMKWLRHHNKSRLSNEADLESIDVVLTTYHTVSADWRNRESFRDSSLLFQREWRRIVLDEAHVIRNKNSCMAKAVCSIEGRSRWAITGTPIQNRMSDLAALLVFLRVDPYCDTLKFDTDISNLWKSGNSQEAADRLRRLAGPVVLRRPKATVNLPARRDLRCQVDFSADERRLYDQLKNETIGAARHTRTDALAQPHTSEFLVNFIQQINALRMICSMGLHYSVRHHGLQSGPPRSPSRNGWENLAQEVFNNQCDLGSVYCHLCTHAVTLTEAPGDSGQELPHAFAECLRFICSDCLQGHGSIDCGHDQKHSLAPVSVDRPTLNDTGTTPDFMDSIDAWPTPDSPSKVNSLIDKILSQPSGTKSVVFSTWRMTLDVVEAGLKKAQIYCVRYDGNVKQSDRKEVIGRFRNDASVKVMLLTLSCGAVGLTLTEASYAYLMEPHWNPTIEEQALARIHRLGQHKEVTTVRFFVRDTFEERVIEVQESKRDLASALFAGPDGTEGVSASRLEWLCHLL